MQQNRFFYLTLMMLLFAACGKKESFKDKIVQDVIANMGKGACDDVLAGAKIDNVVVGELIPLKTEELIDVTVSFDYEIKGITKRATTVFLYSTKDGKKVLDEIGKCKYSNIEYNKQ